MNNLISSFILGGMFTSFIYYSSNNIKKPELAALISAIPLSLFSCMIISDNKILIKYSKHTSIILLLTSFAHIFLIFLLLKLNNKKLSILISFIFWLLLITLKIAFFDK